MTTTTRTTATPTRLTRRLDRIGAVVHKDLRQWARDWQALVGPMLIPLVLMLLCGILFGFGGDEWNIGLVNEGAGPHAAAFEREIRDLRGDIGPYFRVVTTDADEAGRLVTEGRLQLAVTIPEDFDERIVPYLLQRTSERLPQILAAVVCDKSIAQERPRLLTLFQESSKRRFVGRGKPLPLTR